MSTRFYYGDVLLPEFPQEIQNCNYLLIFQEVNNLNMYTVLGSNTTKMYVGTSGNYIYSNNTVYYSNFTIGTSIEWGTVFSGNYTFHSNKIIWSNYDIPQGSSGSSTIYFKAGTPIPYYEEGIYKTAQRFSHSASDSTALAFNLEVEAGDAVVIGLAARSQFSVPDGFTLCFTSEPCGNQTLSMMYKFIKNTGIEEIVFSGTESALTYATIMILRNVGTIRYSGDYYRYFKYSDGGGFSTNIVKNKANQSLIWSITCNYALTSTGYDYVVTPKDMQEIQSGDPLQGPVRLKMFFDDGTGASIHSLNYPMSGEYNYAINAIELYPFIERLLIRSEDSIYTIQNNQLVILNNKDITSEVFNTYGFMKEDLSNELLLTLNNPEILYWQSDADAKTPTIKTVLTATPQPQEIISNAIDLTNSSIQGIDSASAIVEGDITIAVSKDNKTTWYMHNGTDWINAGMQSGMNVDTFKAITTEQWNEFIVNADKIYLKINLTDTEQSISEIKLQFII